MKSQLRSQVAALFLLAPAAISFSALPTAALAQPAAPEVRSLEVTSDRGVQPGSRLRFRLEGSPRAQASVRIRGVQGNIPLREVERGVYVGRYIVNRSDRIEDQAPIRAVIRQGNRTATASYNIPAGMVAGTPPAPPLRIERFAVTAQERLEPGAELRFTLEGAPGALAVIDLPGVQDNVQLREVRPGFYEGAYTIRRSDNLNPSGPVVATLRLGDRVVTANLATPLGGADNRPPIIANLSPREGDRVQGGPATVVSGQFQDRGGSGVDPASVRIVISGRNVTNEAQVTPESFTYRAALPPGHHTVDVTARDRAGNSVRRSWSFDIASGPVSVPIQILSHGNNAQIEGNGAHVRGRTAPFATVTVKVNAVPPVVGQFGVAQQVFSQTLQADANGNFDFSFSSPFPVPGTRYEVAMVATKADVTTESRLVLFQRQG
ncbi:MAG TPA: hypothetical protein VLI46_10250 [Ramlibacter sp.]|nr:hypothetical protein [Ramlibacter sp.]